jgi:type IV pilus assembly protein PilZ
MTSLPDVRRAPRVALGSAVEYTREGSHERLAGRARDISLGGMFIETPAPLAFGAALFVHLRVQGVAHVLTIPAIVRWRQPGGMGVQFGLVGARDTYVLTQLARPRRPAAAQTVCSSCQPDD